MTSYNVMMAMLQRPNGQEPKIPEGWGNGEFFCSVKPDGTRAWFRDLATAERACPWPDVEYVAAYENGRCIGRIA